MGAVLVERGGETLLRAAYGPAEAELDVANRPEAVFRIGSLTKPFTATAVLRAVERGEMALDDRICSSLSPCPSSWSGVTVHHLLSHTSGIPDSFGRLEAVPVEETAAELGRVLAELVEEGEALDSAPGEAYRYSNFDYVLLGVLLELAEGAPWAEVLAREIFRPLAMTGTAYDDVWALVPGRVRGYRLRNGSLANTEYDDHAACARPSTTCAASSTPTSSPAASSPPRVSTRPSTLISATTATAGRSSTASGAPSTTTPAASTASRPTWPATRRMRSPSSC
jgi:CubicO group peptidase (beta-lactamase class C family)